VIDQAQGVLTAWNQIDESLAFGALNAEALAADLANAQGIDSEIAQLEKLLISKRNQRSDAYSATLDKVKRMRAGVKAMYGDDSSEFELVGGTRLSERKSPTRKAVPASEITSPVPFPPPEPVAVFV
jgi:hypothetical protein